MVSRVPLLGMVVAVALLLGENLGANAYVAAKQRAADTQAALEQRGADRRLEIHVLLEEFRQKEAALHGDGPPSPARKHEIERLRCQLGELQATVRRLHATKL